jgi:lysophospholipase L1-like esterase
MASSPSTIYLFAGDSLTEGVYGENYVERIATALTQGRFGLQGQVVNAGSSGDTVTSLRSRLPGLLAHHQPDWLVLAIGSNDVWLPWLSSHSLGWRLWLAYRQLRTGRRPTTDLDHFAATYRSLVDSARQAGARVLACTVAPIGERFSSPVNQRVARLNGVIKHLAADQHVPMADIWQAFVETLAAQPQRSAYLPGEWLFAGMDRRRYRQAGADEMASRRRLALTFDGIHLNSQGADLWAETVLRALARTQSAGAIALPALARHLNLPCFLQGALQVCASPGWETRAGDVARLLASAYDQLSVLTGAQPSIRLALLTSVHWEQGACPVSYPRPCAAWDGQSGTVFVPDTYEDDFLRDMHLPRTVAAWTSWPPALSGLEEPAQATALADLLAVEELGHLFLRSLRIAPDDPALRRLLAAYLAQIVIRSAGIKGRGGARMATLWNVWGEVLERAGLKAGALRLQARDLYAQHGENLVASLAGTSPQAAEGLSQALVIDRLNDAD